ncbi:MAG TPA: NAD-dependent epimerase/dehydratase family protein [Phototrophicaceae bacterium]|jgi:nucleoside-diphosphate-sugar epimerase|nr:NAD-dependent epimerase/dehydratase family protein [Phototrophicaceae bacterium]
MKILVIGGTRFIGLAVVRQLQAHGHQVAVFNRGQTAVDLPEGVTHIAGDKNALADSRAVLAEFAPDVVMHNIVTKEKDAQAALDVFTGLAKRLVMVSSMDVYAPYGRLIGTETGDPLPIPFDESAPLREAWYPYRAQATDENDFRFHYDKIPAERLVLTSKDLPGTVLRLPMVYGENDFQHRLMPFFKPMDDGRSAIVLDEGYANWRSTYGYVENVAAAIVRACEDDRANGKVYNIGDLTPSMLELGEMVKTLVGWQGEFVTVPTENLPESLHTGMDTRHSLAATAERIQHDLGYQPVIDRETAMRRTIAWEREHLPPEANFAEMYAYDTQDEVLRTIRA